MQNGYFTRSVWKFCQKLLSLAHYRIRLVCKDDASSNNLFCADDISSNQEIMVAYIECLNQQTMLGDMDVLVSTFRTPWLQKINGTSTFFNLEQFDRG